MTCINYCSKLRCRRGKFCNCLDPTMAFILQFPLYRDFQFCTSQVHQQRGDKYRIYKRRSFYQSALLHIFWENVNTRKLQQTDQVLNLDNCKIIARSWEGDMWTGGNIHISSLKLLAEQSAPSLHHQKTTLMHSQQNWLKKGIHTYIVVLCLYHISNNKIKVSRRPVHS